MRLKELRIKHGLTQKQVAEIVGLSLKTYRKYESGDWGKMKVTTIFKFMQYYGISCEYLMGK